MTIAELLAGAFSRYPHKPTEPWSLDYGLPSAVLLALSKFCRIREGQIRSLDMQQQLPGLKPDWLSCASPSAPMPLFMPTTRVESGSCIQCIRNQILRQEPAHLLAEWGLAFLTHCPKHAEFLHPSCSHCWGAIVPLSSPTLAKLTLRCPRCGVPRENTPIRREMETALPSILSLEAAVLQAVRGQAADPVWAGHASTGTFLNMVEDLIWLLTHRWCGAGPILASRVGSAPFVWNSPISLCFKHPVFGHLGGLLQLMVMATLTQFLMGPRGFTIFKPEPYPAAEGLAVFPLRYEVLSMHELKFIMERSPAWPQAVRSRLAVISAWVGRREAFPLYPDD